MPELSLLKPFSLYTNKNMDETIVQGEASSYSSSAPPAPSSSSVTKANGCIDVNGPMVTGTTSTESIPKQVRRKVDYHASFIGAKGKSYVKKMLKDADSIKPLQERLGFQIPRMAPALAFLEAMNKNKEAQEKKEKQKQSQKQQQINGEDGGHMYKIHSHLLADLKGELEEKLNSLPEVALEKMLDQTVKYIVIPEMKSVPMQIIKLIKGSIKENVCRFLAYDSISHVVSELPLPIRQQVWMASHKLFLGAISENCTLCLNQTEKSMADMRAPGSPAKLLADSIGQSDVLFSYFADYCSRQAIQQNIEYGSIIQHVLICLSSNKIKSILKLHDLAIIIDRVKTNKDVDENSFDGMVSTFKSLMGSQKEGIGNFLGGMVQRNPLPTMLARAPVLTSAHLQQPGGNKRSRPTAAKKNKGKPKSKKRNYDSDDGGYASYGDSDEEYDGTDDRPVRKRKARDAKSSARRAAMNKAVYNTINIDEILSQVVKVEPTKIDKDDLSENTLLDIYEDAILFITKMDLQGWFAFPVTDQMAPNYSKIIDRPMDLSTIRVKVQQYRCLEELSDDIELMFNNCMDFNIEGVYYEGAQFMFEKWQMKKTVSSQLIEELGEEFAAEYMPHREKYLTERVDPPARKPRSLLKVSSSSSSLDGPLSIPKLVDELTSYLQNIDSFSLFLNPVTDDFAPGYSDIVKHPMDISSMRKKKNMYQTSQEVSADVDLMLYNSLSYNHPGDPIYNATIDIQKQWTSKRQSVIDGSFTIKKAPSVARSVSNTSKPKVQRQSSYMAAALNSSRLADDSGLLAVLREAWNYMRNIDEQKIFHEAFDVEGYRSIIKNPMDLQTMERKLAYFTSVDDIDQDVRLMLNNCVVFNKGAWGETYANKMLRLWGHKVNSFREKETNLLLDNDYDHYYTDPQYAMPIINDNSFKLTLPSRTNQEYNNSWGLYDASREYLEGEEHPMQPQPEEPEDNEEMEESAYVVPPVAATGDRGYYSDDDDKNEGIVLKVKPPPPKLMLSLKPKTSVAPVPACPDHQEDVPSNAYVKTDINAATTTTLKLNLKTKFLAVDDSKVKKKEEENLFGDSDDDNDDKKLKQGQEKEAKEGGTETTENEETTQKFNKNEADEDKMEIGTTSIQFPGNKNASISGREIETDAGIATGKQPEENSNEGTHYTAVDSGQDSAQSNHEEDISQAVNVTSTEQPMKNGESASSTNNSNVGTDAAVDNASAVTEEVFEEKEEVHLKEDGATEAHTKLMWGVIMLREKSVHMLLRRYLAKRLEMVVTREHKLPSDDEKFRYAYQLYQLSLPLRLHSVGSKVLLDIPGEDELLTRRILPYVLLKFFNAEKNTPATERTKQFYKELITESIRDAGVVCEYRQEGTVLGSEDSEKLLLDLLLSWNNFRASLKGKAPNTKPVGTTSTADGGGAYKK